MKGKIEWMRREKEDTNQSGLFYLGDDNSLAMCMFE